MTTARARAWLSPEFRVAMFYFTQMMPLGIAVVYAGIWFTSKGITSDQIGIINALPVLIMISLNLTVGRIADRASDWRHTIVLCAVIQGLATLGLFLVDEFWGILAVWTLSIVPNSAIGPVLDAASIRLTKRNGTNFGALRAYGTLGYMVNVGFCGWLIARFDGQIFVPLYVGFSILKAVVAQTLPRFRTPQRVGSGELAATKPRSRLASVIKPWFVLPLVGYAMVFGTHTILNAFAALLWKEQGISETVIGQLIMLSALSEACMMFAWGYVGPRITVGKALLLAALVTTLRWTAMGFSPPVGILVLLQSPHAITFALGYLSCVHFIALHTREEIAAEAHSFYVVLQQSASVIAVVGFGWLTGIMGARAYYTAAGFTFIGLCIIFAGITLDNRRCRT